MLTRGRAARKLAGLITRRSQVQILSSQPKNENRYMFDQIECMAIFLFCSFSPKSKRTPPQKSKVCQKV